MTRKYNPRLIKKRHTYTVREIADLLGMHIGSVRRWIVAGNLIPIEGGSVPYLIYGENLVEFLAKKKQKRKCPLQPDEFYCMKCHCARKSTPTDLSIAYTANKIGKHNKYVGIRNGKCEVCGAKMFRFLTYEKDTSKEIS
jgi:transposase